jgi:hypothetical protein
MVGLSRNDNKSSNASPPPYPKSPSRFGWGEDQFGKRHSGHSKSEEACRGALQFQQEMMSKSREWWALGTRVQSMSSDAVSRSDPSERDEVAVVVLRLQRWDCDDGKLLFDAF